MELENYSLLTIVDKKNLLGIVIKIKISTNESYMIKKIISKNKVTKIYLTLAALIIYLIPINMKADTINETSRYAFASLIDELTECSIFYSIMGAGGDNTGNLSEHSKRFLKLSEQLTLMTLSLAEKIDLKRETIMSKAERFSKEMGEQIGYDGINISILTNKHGDFCRNLTENPEERLIFWIGKESK